MSKELIARASEVIATRMWKGMDDYAQFYSTLALIDLDGYPATTTMSISKQDGIHHLYFTTALDSNVAKRIQQCNRASVCVNSAEYHISLVGTIEILTNLKIKQELWYEGLPDYFSGPEDPNYCVLRFTTERYNIFVDGKVAIGKLD